MATNTGPSEGPAASAKCTSSFVKFVIRKCLLGALNIACSTACVAGLCVCAVRIPFFSEPIAVNHADALRLRSDTDPDRLRLLRSRSNRNRPPLVLVHRRRPNPQPSERSWAMRDDRLQFGRTEGDQRSPTVKLPGYRRHLGQSTGCCLLAPSTTAG